MIHPKCQTNELFFYAMDREQCRYMGIEDYINPHRLEMIYYQANQMTQP